MPFITIEQKLNGVVVLYNIVRYFSPSGYLFEIV
jgi:hypothetical protein